MKGYPLNPDHVVNAVGLMQFTGNVVPLKWFHSICLENGKPDLPAIVILAEIVYWYRPVEIFDGPSGELVAKRKKFKADKLQISYEAFGEKLNLSKFQVKRATDNLVRLGVIKKEFKTIRLEGGQIISNVLYIGLNFERLYEVTN